MVKKSKWTPDMALTRLRRWCAEQERGHEEVRSKLIAHQVYGNTLEEIMSQLIVEGFLNEERFALAYASGKHRMNLWGKKKISIHLKQKKVSAYCINKALSSLDEEEYRQNIKALIEKKMKTVKAENPYTLRQKLSAYLLQKGYIFEEFIPFLEDVEP